MVKYYFNTFPSSYNLMLTVLTTHASANQAICNTYESTAHIE